MSLSESRADGAFWDVEDDRNNALDGAAKCTEHEHGKCFDQRAVVDRESGYARSKNA